ncbi:MAG: hypothetical protein Q7J57_04555, partial [Gemmobacter sp.]|nr:hypothetical protein [Gemmobacter sp.]
DDRAGCGGAGTNSGLDAGSHSRTRNRHGLDVVGDVCDDVVVMRYGVTLESGPVASVLLPPKHTHTRDLLTARPQLRSADLSAVRGATDV